MNWFCKKCHRLSGKSLSKKENDEISRDESRESNHRAYKLPARYNNIRCPKHGISFLAVYYPRAP